MESIFTKPSYYSLVLNGILVFTALIVLIINYSALRSLDIYELINLILFFAGVLGVHGLLQLGLEVNYGFNPIKYMFYKK
jgi:hypothetical protein